MNFSSHSHRFPYFRNTKTSQLETKRQQHSPINNNNNDNNNVVQ